MHVLIKKNLISHHIKSNKYRHNRKKNVLRVILSLKFQRGRRRRENRINTRKILRPRDWLSRSSLISQPFSMQGYMKVDEKTRKGDSVIWYKTFFARSICINYCFNKIRFFTLYSEIWSVELWIPRKTRSPAKNYQLRVSTSHLGRLSSSDRKRDVSEILR